MQRVDDLLIGAGPAAAGVCAALTDRPAGARRSLLILGGSTAGQRFFARSRYGPADADRVISEARFGLPAVRAFGSGGSTKLWHGGLFVPHPDDEIASIAGRETDLRTLLATFAASPAARYLPLAAALDLVNRDTALGGETPWRTVMVPTRGPALVTPLALPLGSECRFDDRAALDFRRSASGSWLTRVVGSAGVETIESGRIILAAGCLGSLQLFTRSLGLEETGFTDHLHVFAGVLSRRDLPPELLSLLGPRASGLDGYSRRHIWKERIATPALDADVGLSFRAVANPEFPRSGRKYGRFLGARASGLTGKLALGIRHPVTAVEMLAYKFGIELPFDSYLVHATISPRGAVGRMTPDRCEFSPPSESIAAAAAEAFARFTRHFGVDAATGTRTFDRDSIAQSIISGAQFAGGPSTTDLAADGLLLADTASMRFTSIYNQGLLSMLIGYRCGRQASA